MTYSICMFSPNAKSAANANDDEHVQRHGAQQAEAGAGADSVIVSHKVKL